MDKTDQVMNDLFTGLCAAMKQKLELDPTAQDLNVIRQFLKDNNISALAAKGSPLASVVEAFPFEDENDDNNQRHNKIKEFA